MTTRENFEGRGRVVAGIACLPLAGLPDGLVDELRSAGLDPARLHAAVADALAEDLPGPDVTSWSTIPPDQVETADLVAREAGTVAGLAVAELVFRYVLGGRLEVRRSVADGARVSRGDALLSVTGPTALLLTAERTALNFLSHLSGVASATAAWVAALDGHHTRVLDTRKTLPGYRALQKYAVRCGGGVNHRFSLSDKAMVKDNHVLAAGGVVPALDAVRRAHPDVEVIVEATDLDQVRELLEAGCTWVLLDNMSPETMTEAVRIRETTGGTTVLEASGGITLERAPEIASTGVDFVSVGALTHSVRVFDIGMDLR